jgi:hypothetical protein
VKAARASASLPIRRQSSPRAARRVREVIVGERLETQGELAVEGASEIAVVFEATGEAHAQPRGYVTLELRVPGQVGARGIDRVGPEPGEHLRARNRDRAIRNAHATVWVNCRGRSMGGPRP